MARFSYKITIDAKPQTIFPLIAGVTDFKKYSRFIEDIKDLGDDVYEWHINVAGVPLSWKARVTHKVSPKYFSYESIEGLYNRGSYTLKRVEENKTQVTYEMTYKLPNKYIEFLLSPFISSVIKALSKELLNKVSEEIKKNKEYKGG